MKEIQRWEESESEMKTDFLLMKEWGRAVTRHIRRTRHGRIRRAADAQLPVAVVAPALDPTPPHNRARVVFSQGDGDGGKA
jgi:hypothetical protein